MKKFLALVLTLALCLGLAAPALALAYGEEYAGYTAGGSQQYRDVPDTHWAYQSIATCSQRTWFNGYPDGTFRPEGLITREEAAKVFAVAMGLELEKNPTVTYTDTKDNWAKAYIEATKPLFPNVANLQGTSSFRPTQTITREETIYALVVAWGYGSKTKNADLSVLNMFSDTNSVSAGVKPYLAVAVSEGLVSGLPNGTIAAQKGLTRAEFATLLARALSHGYGDTKQEFQAPKLILDKYSATTDKATLTVTGSVTPADDVTVTLDGNDVRVSSGGSFSVNLTLKVGANTFTLTAENAYGAKDTKTITVERTDELTISLSTFDAKTEAEEVTLSGTVTPPGGVTLTVDGAEVPTTSAGAFHVTLPLEVGANVFEFSAKNANGTTAAKSVKITREFVAPEPDPSPESSPEPSSEPTQEPEESSSGSAATTEPTSTKTPDPDTLDSRKVALIVATDCRTYEDELLAKLLFMDATTQVVTVSKLDGKDVVRTNPGENQIDKGKALAQIDNHRARDTYPAFYAYHVVDGEYELTQLSGENGWMGVEAISNTTVWASSNFAEGIAYTADSNTVFVVSAVDQYGDVEYFCYSNFSTHPVWSHVSGCAIGTCDNPGVAKYVFLYENT